LIRQGRLIEQFHRARAEALSPLVRSSASATRDGGASVYCHDPSGNGIELISYAAG
jgi:catechol-2,3-dioxygenase